ncbi:MAG: regulatory protein GemA [Hafnia sp.]
MKPNKNGLIGAIKAGQSYLGWDDETYRDVLVRLTGKTSSVQCSLEALQNVREYMHQQGFPRTVAKKNGRKPSVAKGKKSILSKIEALLADAKRPWQYAEKMAQHMFNVRYVDWLTEEQLIKLMQALIVDAKRRNREDSLDG